jgi:hypothetical protein
LHDEYGPVVRIAPNEVSFTSWAALKEIYCSGGSGYDKSDFYNLFRIFGRRFVYAENEPSRCAEWLADKWQNHVHHVEQGRCEIYAHNTFRRPDELTP